MLKPAHVCERALIASITAIGIGMASVPTAFADDIDSDPSLPSPVAPVQVAAAPTSDGAAPEAVAACSQFAQVLDGSSTYYGDFADSFEGSDYNDPAVSSSNATGRTALRESAAFAMTAAQTPGLDPAIADPIRVWSIGATKLLVKMGLRIPGNSLNDTATEMNNQAVKVQEACAAAGTHA